MKSRTVLKAMCATCPFRDGSPTEHLRTGLAASAITSCSRICHNTGPANVVNDNPKGEAKICRGARDLQLRVWVAMGLLEVPTDECWQQKCDELGIVRDAETPID